MLSLYLKKIEILQRKKKLPTLKENISLTELRSKASNTPNAKEEREGKKKRVQSKSSNQPTEASVSKHKKKNCSRVIIKLKI